MAYKSSIILCVYLLTVSLNATAALVTITGQNVGSQAHDDSSVTVYDLYTGNSTSITTILNASSGNSSSTSEVNYSSNTNNAVFSVDMSHSINNIGGVGTGTGTLKDLAMTKDDTLLFTANSNSTYSISGQYDVIDKARVYSDVFLIDVTAGIYLFRENEESRSTDSESFAVNGIADGDYQNYLSGLLTGDLIAGHDYRFSFFSYIQAADINFNEIEAVASATGNITLTVSSVPVPATAWLFGSGLIGLIGLARRK